MRFLAFLVLVAALASVVAYVTKPDAADAEATLKDQLLLALAKEELKGKNPAEQLAITICRTSPNECYNLVRRQIDSRFEDKGLYVQLDLAGFDHSATCYGAFTQFFCPGGLVKD
ncbi:hypothetical protein [Pseudaestuariivita atlantica]|uniref:Uncharacterized protein n=1 Tax=Pseudaestuariivita atlantica TaxID=1317121 RepID=A0A0L1JR57_9RHOB|nr:hypothetical protein [Pseudaestuariivita atlantica]KNG94274.1 hypothetical protein ATO11_08680 [Pseudaestuariivita atlantica]